MNIQESINIEKKQKQKSVEKAENKAQSSSGGGGGGGVHVWTWPRTSNRGCVKTHGLFFPVQVRGDLASLFSHSSLPLSFVGSLLCGCWGCARALPESVTGMLATSSPGYIKPY